VYLTENPPTCLAEKMFYFQREVLTALDGLHLPHSQGIPPFSQQFVLWCVVLRNPITNVFDLSIANAPAAGASPCLVLNPSQDYHHLNDRRADIQAAGYQGIRAPSTRVVGGGNMVALFDDQSKNLHSITPYEVEFRLITPGPPPRVPFASHATDLLDYLAGEVRIIAPPAPAALPPVLIPFAAWTVVPSSRGTSRLDQCPGPVFAAEWLRRRGGDWPGGRVQGRPGHARRAVLRRSWRDENPSFRRGQNP
jgi:hypothetical protein